MGKVICYSLFGWEQKQHESCFDFFTYIRGLTINIRLNRLLFPDWKISLQTDTATNDRWGGLFEKLPIEVNVNASRPLTMAMLWRLIPAFEGDNDGWKYSHVLCRDLDSPPTYREAQAVQDWISRDKTMHAITDSVSHNLPLLGGMIGVIPAYFSEKVGVQTWKDLVSMGDGMDFSVKGADQEFLNRFVYPCVASPSRDSITQHYFNGHGNTFLSDFHTCNCPPPSGHADNCPNNTPLPLDPALKESNAICGHIGAAGAYSGALTKFLVKYRDKFSDIREAESKYPDVFYWLKENTF